MKHSLQETDLWGFLFCFILLNICYYISYRNRDAKRQNMSSWWLALGFCVFAVWNADYFTLEIDFRDNFKEFRDFLYPYLSYISLGSYSIFRFLVWGGAIYFYALASKRLKLSLNITVYSIIFLYLLNLSYPRASLAMSLYFYGLSILLTKSCFKSGDIFKVVLLFVFSFIAHRSMAILIAMTPLTLFKLSKKSIFGIILVIPSVASLALMLFTGLSDGISFLSGFEEFENLNKTVEVLSSLGDKETVNWRFMFSKALDYSAFYVSALFVCYVFLKKANDKIVPDVYKRMMIIVLALLILGVVFLSQVSSGMDILGYRLLYMTGIPLALCLSFVFQNGLCKKRSVVWVFLPAILYSESYMIGKILTAMKLW